MEGLCGAFIQESTSFPSGIARGSGWDPKLEEKIGAHVARQEASCGITHILAPCWIFPEIPEWDGRERPTGRIPSPPPWERLIQEEHRVRRRTAESRRVWQSISLGFTTHREGSTEPTAIRRPGFWRRSTVRVFQAAIRESGLGGSCPAIIPLTEKPASVSHTLLTGLLRERMGFDGLRVSDYGGINNADNVQKIGETQGETGLLAMEAGMDIEMPNAVGYGEKLKDMFRSGQADMEVLDRTVLRILEAKFRMGLFEHPFAMTGEELHKIFEDPAGRELSLQSARESMVLLKNNGALPLKKEIRKLAVIGPHADCARKFFGGYTHLCMMESVYAVANSIAGVESSEENGSLDAEVEKRVPGTQIQSDEARLFDDILKLQKPDCRSLVSELRERMPETELLYAYGYPIAGED